MADTNYIIPGGGIVQDTEEGFEPIIPGMGIYQEQAAVGGVIGSRLMTSNLFPTVELFKGVNL